MNILTIQFISGWIYLFGLIACSNHTANNPDNKFLLDKFYTTTHNANLSSLDTSVVPKEVVTKIYAQSIAQYIKSVHGEYKIAFDTLFFIKREFEQSDDFPDIELPLTMENTQIRLITPDSADKKQKADKSAFWINLIGWVEKDKAEFIFVTFSNGFEHQFDCFINYRYDNKLNEFDLEALRFENYLVKKKD